MPKEKENNDSLYVEWKHDCPHAVYSGTAMEGDFERARSKDNFL